MNISGVMISSPNKSTVLAFTDEQKEEYDLSENERNMFAALHFLNSDEDDSGVSSSGSGMVLQKVHRVYPSLYEIEEMEASIRRNARKKVCM